MGVISSSFHWLLDLNYWLKYSVLASTNVVLVQFRFVPLAALFALSAEMIARYFEILRNKYNTISKSSPNLG